MEKYWQGEITKGDDVLDIDFPRRQTKEEAFNDAASRATGYEQPSSSEWEETADGYVVNTGRSFVGEA